MAKPIPEGFHSVTPYLIVSDCNKALEFYKAALGAEERYRMPMPNGKIGHAELQIGDSIVMLADELPEMDARSPTSLGGTPVGLCIYCDDADKLFQRALRAGASEERPMKDQFYGDRSGTVRDPFGHKWTIATHKEDLTPQQIGERAKKEMAH